MKEIPILMSTPMVQAILQGRKTQTRRNIKDSLDDRGLRFTDHWEDWHGNKIKCPYGQPGDLLWVRENWQLKGWDFEEGTMTVKFATGETHKCFAHDPDEDSSWLIDKVDQLEDRGFIKPDPTNEEMFVFTDKKQLFSPSIHMPKGAARIWLQVIDVRVERLQDISGYDVLKEGVGSLLPAARSMTQAKIDYESAEPGLKKAFSELWSKINGADSWSANPWIWVISFEVLSTTGKPILHPSKNS